MRTQFKPKNNPRVIIIQKLYGKLYNENNNIDFPKHRFKKFIKDIVLGNCKGISCSKDNINFIKDLFTENKFSDSVENSHPRGYPTTVDFCVPSLRQSGLKMHFCAAMG